MKTNHPTTNAHVTNDSTTTSPAKKGSKTMSTRTSKPTTETSTPTAAPVAAPPPAVPSALSPVIAATPVAPPVTTFLTPPPNVHSPLPPPGFEVPPGVNYRGVRPVGTETAAIASALKDLARFAPIYAQVLGATAPPLDHLIEGLTVAAGWTGLRAESSAWDAYCSTEEGMAWQALRPMLDRLVLAFKLAADANKALMTQFPGLATLLGARATIAQKGVSTKRANQKAVAEGKPPIHGAVGKRRQRAAGKVAVNAAAPAAATKASAPAAGVTAGQPAASPAQAAGAATGMGTAQS